MTDEEYQVYVSNFQAFVKAIRLSGYTVLDGEGYEADDYISILTYMLKRNYRVSIVTTDKDMFQLIDENVRVYEPIKQISITMDNFKQFVKIPLKHFLTYKCLRGDDSDNIKGIHGIGEITATELIETYGSFENMVLEISKKEKVSSKEKKILEGKEIFKRNVALMDLRLCFIDDNLKMLVRQKVNDFKASREELFELLGEFQLETLTDKVINPKCLTKQ
jgi:DNA polymerase-1